MSENERIKKPERPPRGMMVKPQKGAFKPIFRVMRYSYPLVNLQFR